MSIEMVNIYDERQHLIGSAPRQDAHRDGLLHDVVHCWVVDPRGEGRIFFQQRSLKKDTFPGFYDIAVGGHISPSETPESAVLREMDEEIGLFPYPEQLQFLGSVRKADYFSEGLDREIGRVFLLLCPEPEFSTGWEVECMVVASVPEFLSRFDKPAITAHTLGGEEVEIPLEQWAGSASREFEDYVLPKLGCVYYVRSDISPTFIDLCSQLDAELDATFGRTENRMEHALHNTVEAVEAVVLAYEGDEAIGCAALRPRDSRAEVKRVFVRQDRRGLGASVGLMLLLERIARDLGYSEIILETNATLAPALTLYLKLGYKVIDKYPPYENMQDALCMGKEL